MRAGDLLFSTGTDLLNTMIRSVTKGPYSHVAIALSADTILEAVEGGVVEEREVMYTGTVTLTGHQCTTLEPALEWARQQKGKPYDYRDFLEIGLYTLFPELKKPPVPEDDIAYTCGELAGYFLLKAGYPFNPPRTYSDMEYVSPNTLYSWLKIT